MTNTIWRKSSRSNSQSACIELANTGLVRDSKNPDGPVLRADLPALVAATRTGLLDR